MAKTEQAKYSIAQSPDAIEVRHYAPRVIASVSVSGSRKAALKKGFHILAGYIFGENQSTKFNVITGSHWKKNSEKIAMTAPVEQSGKDESWRVSLTMPGQYTRDILPKPNDASIQIEDVAAQKIVAIRFSWLASDKALEKNRKSLDAFIERNNIKTVGDPIYAYYNPPWTLPWLRRNEVMYQLAE